jgi:hypothetical protein
MTALCGGCAVFGKNMDEQSFDPAPLDTLVPGHTRAANVTDMFGAPAQVVKLSNGNAYTYKRSIAKGTALWLVLVTFGNYETQYDQIVFFFNDQDILTHYGARMNAEKASYGVPF